MGEEKDKSVAGTAEQTGRRSRLPVWLPVAGILAALALVTLLLATRNNSPALPNGAHSEKSSSFAGATVSPRQKAPGLGGLRNYLGEPVSLGEYRGKAVFVTFLYTHCPDVCPLETAELHNTLARLGPTRSKELQVIAVSVDPHGDDRETVARFVDEHGMKGRMKYLIGDADQLAPVWEDWNVGSTRDSAEPEFVAHSALIYGISASGQLTTIYPSNFKPAEIVHDLPRLLAG